MAELQRQMIRLKDENKGRSTDRPNPDLTLGPSPTQQLHDEQRRFGPKARPPSATYEYEPQGAGMGLPRWWGDYSWGNHFPSNTYQEYYRPPMMHPPPNFVVNDPRLNGSQNDPGRRVTTNNTVAGPGRVTVESRGYDPMPSRCYPNMMLDPCPPFTPNMYQNWKREIKLWIAGQPGATVTQILAKLIRVMPLSTKAEALMYMESTERSPESRSVDRVIEMLDVRYARTDSERACSWLTAFTEFKRESNENYKDFWARFNRCTAKLTALGMGMTDQVIFNRSIQALRVPGGQLPIILSALET